MKVSFSHPFSLITLSEKRYQLYQYGISIFDMKKATTHWEVQYGAVTQ